MLKGRAKLLGMLFPFLALFAALLMAQDYEMLVFHATGAGGMTMESFIRDGLISGVLDITTTELAKNWYTDYPTGDRNLVDVLQRLTYLDVAPESRAIPIHHADLFNYPMIYSGEAGQMRLDTSDASVLREYLTRGGFWMIDDFWGTFEWSNFEREMKKIFPDRPIVDIPLDHPIFHTFYDIDQRMQVPNIGYAYNPGSPTWEQDGYQPYVRGIVDDNKRLLVFINFNTDLMDASEWADDALYPHKFSAYSYKIFSNAVIYALSH